MPRSRLCLLALPLLAACSTAGGNPGTIVVPPPGAEPTPLAGAPSPHHVHGLLQVPGGLLVATHTGLLILAPGGASPRPVAGVGGDVLQLAQGDGGAVYLAGHNLGVQVSHDGGATWAAASPDVAGLDVHGLAADPRDRRTLFAYAVGKGILVSHDAGARWTHLPGDADRAGFYLTGLAVTADGTLLAGSPQLGVAASTDRGGHFLSVYQGTGRVYSLAASASNADVVFAAGDGGIFITQDGGKDWNAGATSDTVTGVAVDPADSSHFFAGGADGAVFESHDGGETWKLVR